MFLAMDGDQLMLDLIINIIFNEQIEMTQMKKDKSLLSMNKTIVWFHLTLCYPWIIGLISLTLHFDFHLIILKLWQEWINISTTLVLLKFVNLIFIFFDTRGLKSNFNHSNAPTFPSKALSRKEYNVKKL